MLLNTALNFNDGQFFETIKEITASKLYEKDLPELGYLHRISHIQKVIIFSQLIAQNEGLDEEDTKILLACAAFHDIGRVKDRGDNGIHGAVGARLVKEYLKNNINNKYKINENEVGIMQVAINYHVIKDGIKGNIDNEMIMQLCDKYDVEYKDLNKTITISKILKDADALDRFRFCKDNPLDIESLRTNTAKNGKIIEIAKKINQEYAIVTLNSNYSYLSKEDNPLITLQEQRKHYIETNKKIKKERTIPVRDIKKIYEDCLKNKKYNKDLNSVFKNYGRISIGGTGKMFLIKDPKNNQYLFKPAYKKNTEDY